MILVRVSQMKFGCKSSSDLFSIAGKAVLGAFKMHFYILFRVLMFCPKKA
jgi:hypothetical protein